MNKAMGSEQWNWAKALRPGVLPMEISFGQNGNEISKYWSVPLIFFSISPQALLSVSTAPEYWHVSKCRLSSGSSSDRRNRGNVTWKRTSKSSGVAETVFTYSYNEINLSHRMLPRTLLCALTWQRWRSHVLCGCSKSHQLLECMWLMLQEINEIYLLAFFHVPAWSLCFQQRGMGIMHSIVGSHATVNHNVWQQQRSNSYW